ncbi:MAG: hypothetical protein APR63_12415 [Desulfuromonas sp. SDB]|nr:MAG: hypothetical protein APR63_12415 [Desulfuromonas sp. SDB]
MNLKIIFFNIFLIFFIPGSVMATDVMVIREPIDSTILFLIPFQINATDLTFFRDDSVFNAAFKIIVEVQDDKGNLIGGDVWQKRWNTQDYGQTLRWSVLLEDILLLPVRYFERGLVNVIFVDDQSSARIGYQSEFVENVSSVGDIFFIQDSMLLISSDFLPDSTVLAVCASRYSDNRFYISSKYTDLAVFQAEPRNFRGYQLYAADIQLPSDTGTYYIRFANNLDSTSIEILVEDPYVRDSIEMEIKIRQMTFVVPPGKLSEIIRDDYEDKKVFFEEFWALHDPSPNTEKNEARDRYFRRIDFANNMFGETKEGWMTDRGRVYVLLGQPDEIEDYPFQIDSPPYQYWYYYTLGLKFYFKDEHLIGDYRLISPSGWLDIWRDYFEFN